MHSARLHPLWPDRSRVDLCIMNYFWDGETRRLAAATLPARVERSAPQGVFTGLVSSSHPVSKQLEASETLEASSEQCWVSAVDWRPQWHTRTVEKVRHASCSNRPVERSQGGAFS